MIMSRMFITNVRTWTETTESANLGEEKQNNGKKVLEWSLYWTSISTLQDVYVRVCVCVCVCVFISLHRKDFSWLNKTIDVMPEIQVSDGMLKKYFCVKFPIKNAKNPN